jgi:hypothetical protein
MAAMPMASSSGRCDAVSGASTPGASRCVIPGASPGITGSASRARSAAGAPPAGVDGVPASATTGRNGMVGCKAAPSGMPAASASPAAPMAAQPRRPEGGGEGSSGPPGGGGSSGSPGGSIGGTNGGGGVQARHQLGAPGASSPELWAIANPGEVATIVTARQAAMILFNPLSSTLLPAPADRMNRPVPWSVRAPGDRTTVLLRVTTTRRNFIRSATPVAHPRARFRSAESGPAASAAVYRKDTL